MQPSFLNEPDPDRAWGAFVAASMGTIDRATSRAVRDRDLAADVAAEVLERLAKDWPALLRRYEQSPRHADFFVWLAVVARNLAVDVLRSRFGRAHVDAQLRHLQPVSGTEERARELPAEGPGPGGTLIGGEAAQGWADVLAEFSSDERFLIRAYYLEGGTAKSVAAATGLGSAARVYETMKTILRKLRSAAEARGLRAEDCTELARLDWGRALNAKDSNA